jgi:two-component system, OmpR family, phosphate regulon sensor histidine kinase PhoR
MRGGVSGRVVITWCVFLAGLLVSFLWLRADLLPDVAISAFVKLLFVNFCCAVAMTALIVGLSRRWRSIAKRLETLIAGLPATQIILPEDASPDLASLARAMRMMAQRVRLVTERASLELSRRETILACMAEGVLAVDEKLRVILCNEAFAKAFNTRMPVSEGRNLYEIVREPIIRDILEQAIKSGQRQTDRLQLPSAAGRWFEASALPLTEEPRRGAVIVLHDVTDLERQEQVRKDFVADVSHELRTPLAAIRGYAETLLDGGLEDQQNNRKFVEIIQAHAIRLNNIASDLLVLSELDSNRSWPVAPERISLLDVIQCAVHTIEGNAALLGVRVDTLQCQDCLVAGYRFRLEQALTNLLDNAVKFNKPQGQVVIECGPAGHDQVRVSISDTGIGIPSEDLKRIFERFYRVDKARTRTAGGTGLGLPIVKEVVERMGGTITVESHFGRGSKFTILLQAA